MAQIRHALGSGVRYLDGGWQTIVDALATRPGVTIVADAKVDRLDDVGEHAAVIVAVGGPGSTGRLIGRSFDVGPPAEVSVVDLGLSRRPLHDAVLGAVLESITLGFLAVMERLSPLERAVFVLHEVLALPLTDVAEVIERSDVATRQLAKRARDHLAAERPRFDPEPDDVRRLTEMLLAAAATGDLETIRSYLTQDVVAVSDGGAGAERVARYVTNLAGRLEPDTEIHLVNANAQTALYLTRADKPVMLVVPSWFEGRVRAVHSLLNPDKLAAFHRAWRATR